MSLISHGESGGKSNLSIGPPGNWPEQVYFDPNGEQYTLPPEAWRFGNPDLPIAPCRRLICDTVADNIFTIAQGDTGCGKSTQIVQFLYETGCYSRIIATQPRIGAAHSLAMRVREEMWGVVGHDARTLVGYQSSVERDDHPDNKIRFVTDGLELMHELFSTESRENEVLIIDEVHEWSNNIELLLALIEHRAAANPNFRVVIASATMDALGLAEHYSGVNGKPVPIISVSGRPFAVTHVEESGPSTALTVDTKQYGPALAFVAGKREIEVAKEHIRDKTMLCAEPPTVLNLHGDQTAEERAHTISLCSEPDSVTLSTKVGQTSLTLPGIKFVIRGGWERRPFVRDGVQGLRLAPISYASADQQAGRTGRIEDGYCMDASLPGQPPFPGTEERTKYDQPDILSHRLDAFLLRLKAAGINIEELPFYHQPEAETLRHAQVKLKRLGALAVSGEVTDIGKGMSLLPLDPDMARMVIESRKYGHDIAVQVAAAVAIRQAEGIIAKHTVEGSWWLRHTTERHSELIAELDVFIKFKKQPFSNVLVQRKLEKAIRTFEQICRSEGLDKTKLRIPSEEERQNITRCIVAGADELFVQAAQNHYTDERGEIRIIDRASPVAGHSHSGLLVGVPFNIENQARRRGDIVGGTMVSPELLLECAPDRCSSEFVSFRMKGNTPVQVRRLRFDQKDTGKQFETPVEAPSSSLRDFMINSILDGTISYRTLPKAAHIRRVVREVFDLNDRDSMHAIDTPRIVENLLDRLRSCVPETVLTAEDVERYLPDDVSLAQLVSPGLIASIRSASPTKIYLAGQQIPVSYKKGKAELIVQQNSWLLDARSNPALMRLLARAAVVRRQRGRKLYKPRPLHEVIAELDNKAKTASRR